MQVRSGPDLICHFRKAVRQSAIPQSAIGHQVTCPPSPPPIEPKAVQPKPHVFTQPELSHEIAPRLIVGRRFIIWERFIPGVSFQISRAIRAQTLWPHILKLAMGPHKEDFYLFECVKTLRRREFF
ncbi:MAG: hypothetical protein JWM16_3380 [Verrucomicrobiales bacterium]|nr:hypothetical protein [Verrucomicrobiales bacterium]